MGSNKIAVIQATTEIEISKITKFNVLIINNINLLFDTYKGTPR
jgi:hypothetical protein